MRLNDTPSPVVLLSLQCQSRTADSIDALKAHDQCGQSVAVLSNTSFCHIHVPIKMLFAFMCFLIHSFLR